MTRMGSASSEKFRQLLDNGGRASSAPPTRALVQVIGGLHAGAHIKIDRSPMKIGRSLQSDIVLRDNGVESDHAEIVFDGARWSVRASGSHQTLPVLQHRERGRFLRERFDVGRAKLVLSQPATESAKALYEPHLSRQTAIAALFLGALVFTGIVFGKVHRSFDAGATLDPPSLEDVDMSAWPDVEVTELTDGSRHISGFVDSVEDRQALLDELAWGQRDDVSTLRSGDQLAMQLDQVLDSPSIRVRYVGSGVIRLTGEVTDSSELERIQWVMADYENFVSIDNLAEFSPAPREPVRRALPFQIVDVIPGAGGSFGDSNGNRYFVGARLPDGSKLMAVHEDAVEFQLNNEPLLYPIK